MFVAGEPKGKLPTVESFSQLFLIGIWYLSSSQPNPNISLSVPMSISEANQLKKHGKLEMNDEFYLRGVGKTTLGKELIMSVLPADLRDRSVVYNGKELEKYKSFPAKWKYIFVWEKGDNGRYQLTIQTI